MHIDIHGKINRKDNYDLDLGVACMFKRFARDQEFCEQMSNALVQMLGNVIASLTLNKMRAIVNPDPYLDGNWGGDLATLNEQATILGIPSI